MYREYWYFRWLAIAAFMVVVAIKPVLAFAYSAPPALIYDGSSGTTTYETFWLGNTFETYLFAHSDRPPVLWAQAACALLDDAVAAKGATTVYRSVGAAGEVNYVGITNNLARRAAEHLRGSGIQVEKLMGGLSRTDARAVEQTLIEIHGLGRNGGTLLNRINSISTTNPAYAGQLRRGYELLQTIGY